MSEQSLKKAAFKGILWSAVDKLLSRGLAVVVSILIARILDPSDFGLIGMLTIFLAVSQLILDSGFSQALVQKHTPSQADYSTAFWFNIVVGGVLYLILFFCAPLISDFYQTPILTPLLRILGLTLVTGSLTVVQRAKLLIKVDFRSIAVINTSSVLLGSGVAVWAAYAGYGVWALAIQMLLTQLISTSLFWLLGRWRPTMEFSRDSFRSLFKFGSKLLAAGFVATIVSNLYNLIIGKVYKAAELGFYTKGRQLSEMAAYTVNDIINSVTFPLLSSIKENNERLVSVYSRMLSMTAFIIFPTMVMIAVLAKPLVVVLLTDKWLPAVVIIQWLCLARMFTPISTLNLNILNAMGRSDLFLKVDLSKLPLTVGIMAITVSISIEAVVIGIFVDTFICYFINAYFPGKLLNFGIKAQTRIFSKIILSTIVMALLMVGVMWVISSPLLQIVVGLSVGMVSYYFVSKILKIKEIKELESIVLDLAAKFKSQNKR